MKEYNLTTKMKSYQWDELTDEQRDVLTIAKEQVKHSYCPYSHFHVGAAAKLTNGEVIRGCYQENAAYPSGLCAERSALFAAGAQYPEEAVTKLAIACFTGGHFTKEPGSPCGACRQVMAQYQTKGGGKMSVIMIGAKRIWKFEKVDDILPLIFDSI